MAQTTRREFLGSVAACAALTVLPLAHAEERKMASRNWSLGMQGAKTMDCTLGEELRILPQLGYTSMELRDWKLQAFLREWDLGELKQRIEDSGIRVVNISALELLSLGDVPERASNREQHEWYFRTAAELGIPQSMFVHFTDAANGLSNEERLKRAADDLRYMADMAGEHGVKVLYEFLGSRDLPIYNVRDTLEILDRADRPNVGWIFDFYHFNISDRELADLEQSQGRGLEIVHICDTKDLPYEQLAVPNSERLYPGEGTCPNDEILSTLKSIGYGGPFVIELYNNEFMKLPPEQFAQVAAEKTEKLVNRHFA